MKKDSFFLEFIKSGPFLLLIIIAVAVLIGVIIANHRREVIKMKEDVIYVAPPSKK